ncbi:MAG: flagellar biosynthesis protein FlhF [Bacillaceae bacterium]|nr:flagellar biosynthesis protein FlhF [Bacillaceae bacterium]
MHVKRYVVDSMPDALQKIRNDLGKDAVILNTKNVKTGGIMGLFGKKKIEVIAAVDKLRPNPVPKTEKKNPFVQPELNRQQHVHRQQPEAPVTVSKDKDDEQELVRELKDLRGMFLKMLNGEYSQELSHPVLQQVDRKLREQEVEDDVILEITRRLINKWDDLSRLDEKEIWTAVRQIILEMLKTAWSPVNLTDRRKRLYHFVGPTGVGKTTTIAKLASDYVLRQKRSVGFITSDTYRIAAVDQLRTYANILNAPLEVVFSAEDMEQALKRLKGCDVIFMDTAGRNYKNKHYCREINKFLDQAVPSETFLVLSLTSRYKDLEAIMDNFSSLSINRVLFTKTDETSVYGSILNTIYLKNMSLSYLTNGQNVPEDIQPASPETVANLILGGQSNA